MADRTKPKTGMPREILEFYDHFEEEKRLRIGVGKLEKVRTQDILRRYLPPSPAVIMDVGGGAGAYSFWLAGQGYVIHLVDPVALHIEQAKRRARKHTDYPLASMTVGSASNLNHPDSSVDVVLLLGPLYHLTEKRDRIKALQEARRVLRPGGWVFAAAISRFASILDGLFRGYLDDPEFVRIVQRDLQDGQHRNPTTNLLYFTTAFFHLPEELISEVKNSNLILDKILAVDGPGWLLQNFEEHWQKKDKRDRLLDALRRLEDEPSLIGASSHIMVIARTVS